jgi:23S rRNA G2069 N7-methylase RlmK/C1962 C5-methylase RlmI
MDKDPRLMTVEEYGMFLIFQISEAPKGDFRDLMVEHLLNFRQQIEHLENCYDLDPNE